MTVHPHACGERWRAAIHRAGAGGSSPRLWGTEFIGMTHHFLARFIPTPVGNGPSSPSPAPSASVHPHACGERQYIQQQSKQTRGSSPRLWGTVPLCPDRCSKCRFIPTPVGNGMPCIRGNRDITVHPHACGERARSRSSASSARGSSPRLWGTVLRPMIATSAVSVHPHACGERSQRLAAA